MDIFYRGESRREGGKGRGLLSDNFHRSLDLRGAGFTPAMSYPGEYTLNSPLSRITACARFRESDDEYIVCVTYRPSSRHGHRRWIMQHLTVRSHYRRHERRVKMIARRVFSLRLSPGSRDFARGILGDVRHGIYYALMAQRYDNTSQNGAACGQSRRTPIWHKLKQMNIASLPNCALSFLSVWHGFKTN